MRKFVPIIAFALLGAFAGGGCVWGWHGDWSPSGNPFVWNAQARNVFFATLFGGAVIGAAIGALVSWSQWRRH